MSAVAASELSKVGDSWRTPPIVLEAVRDFCGLLKGGDRQIDVDPCSGPGSQVNARYEVSLPDDGLAVSWRAPYAVGGGKVCWVNPPYSDVRLWLVACASPGWFRYENDHAIALVNAATSERWWPTTMQAVCFWRGRIKFLDPSGKGHHTNTRPSALIYWGSAPALFEHVFAKCGWVVRT